MNYEWAEILLREVQAEVLNGGSQISSKRDHSRKCGAVMTTKERMIEAISLAGEITKEDAEIVVDGYLKNGCAKINKHTGDWTFAHGNFGKKDNIQFALHRLKTSEVR